MKNRLLALPIRCGERRVRTGKRMRVMLPLACRDVLSGVLATRERIAVHPSLVRSLSPLTHSNSSSDYSSTLLLQCAHRLLQSHNPRLLLLSARVFLRQHLYSKVLTVCDQVEATVKQAKEAMPVKQAKEEETEVEKIVATARMMKHLATGLRAKACGLNALANGTLGQEAGFFRQSGDVMRLLRGEVTAEELEALVADEKTEAVLAILRSDRSEQTKAIQVSA